MKTIEANNLKQAVKELKALDENLQISGEINEKDKGYYHIILVRIIQKANSVKNEVSLHVQQYTELGFQKLKKHFKYLGYSKLIVLHTPEQVAPVKQVQNETKAQDEAELRKKIEAEVSAEYLERIKALEEQVAKQKAKGQEPQKKPTEIEVDKVSYHELLKFANENGIQLESRKEEDLRQAVKAWLNK